MAQKLNQVCVLAVNGGSSSIKFAFYWTGELLEHSFHGSLHGICLPRLLFRLKKENWVCRFHGSVENWNYPALSKGSMFTSLFNITVDLRLCK